VVPGLSDSDTRPVMHLAAGWSFRHRRTVLTGWPPPSSPAEASQMNASRTAA